MPDRMSQIEARLREALAPTELRLEDESALHAGHEGAKSGGGHFRLLIISRKFEGVAKVGRHRLVYDALKDLMKRDIHALTMTLQTPAEAQGDQSPR